MIPSFDWDPAPLKSSLLELTHEVPSDAGGLLEDYRRFYQLPQPVGTHRMFRESLEGYELALQQWQVPNAVGSLIMVHGYYDHVGLYGNLIDFAQRHKLNVLAFDLPGHGLSSGEPAAIDDFDVYQRIFDGVLSIGSKLWPDTRWVAAGQSTGGATLASWLLRQRPDPETCPVRDVWLLAPLLRPSGWNTGRWVHMLARLFLKRVRRKFAAGSNLNNPVFSEFVATRDPLQARYLSVQWVTALKQWIRWVERQPPFEFPVMMLQGDADETVDWRHNVPRYQTLFPELELHILSGAHHHLVNEGKTRLALLERQLEQRLESLAGHVVQHDAL